VDLRWLWEFDVGIVAVVATGVEVSGEEDKRTTGFKVDGRSKDGICLNIGGGYGYIGCRVSVP